MIDNPLDEEKWLEEHYHILGPYMEKSFARLFFNPALTWAESCSDEFLRSIFAPPATYRQAMNMHATDLIIYMIFEKKITSKQMNSLISKVLSEVNEAYDVIMQDGGGWSRSKGDPDKRQAAVLAWFGQHKARLSYLKKSHLEDQTLYYDGGGQEKRNFTSRLLLKIIKSKVTKEITFQKVHALFKNLPKWQQDGWLRQVLTPSE